MIIICTGDFIEKKLNGFMQERRQEERRNHVMERSVLDLAKYRYACCEEALEDARWMYEAGRYKNALNRAYYSVFHAMRPVNALDGFDSSKHKGVIAYFNQHYA